MIYYFAREKTHEILILFCAEIGNPNKKAPLF
jgi:hypothetical protein